MRRILKVYDKLLNNSELLLEKIVTIRRKFYEEARFPCMVMHPVLHKGLVKGCRFGYGWTNVDVPKYMYGMRIYEDFELPENEIRFYDSNIYQEIEDILQNHTVIEYNVEINDNCDIPIEDMINHIYTMKIFYIDDNNNYLLGRTIITDRMLNEVNFDIIDVSIDELIKQGERKLKQELL